MEVLLPDLPQSEQETSSSGMPDFLLLVWSPRQKSQYGEWEAGTAGAAGVPPGEAGGPAPPGGEGGAAVDGTGIAGAAEPGTGGEERPATAPAENKTTCQHTQQKINLHK